MRYEKAEIVHRIAQDMHGSAEGLTIEDIRSRYSDARLSRRTAERLRDAVDRLHHLEHVNPGELPKRWRIPVRRAGILVNLSANEISSLETAAAVLRRENLDHHARNIDQLAGKIQAHLNTSAMARIATDLEAMAESEGLAFRAGPRPNIDPDVLTALRKAILACTKVRLHYRARGTGAGSRQVVCPYGFLYGNRHYLVAFSMNQKIRDYRLYSLPDIERVDLLPYAFERAKVFSLQNFVRQSFGVFREEPFEVVWRFSPNAAPEARKFVFHPEQKMEDQKDGSLLVSFTAGGALEMAWHLHSWGKQVKVIRPRDFWKRVRKIQDSVTP